MKNKGMKMDNTTMVILLLVAGLLVWRHFGSDKVEEPSDENGEGKDVNEDTEDKNENPNLNVWVKVGSKGSAVKQCQERANTTIILVKKNLKRIKASIVDDAIKTQAEKVSKLTGLKVDGVYGEKTKHVVQTLTGNTGTSLYTLRKKYANWKSIIDKVEGPHAVYPWFSW
jgi:hypothetical protein